MKEPLRSFYYKVTKALCKMLECECLVYEKPTGNGQHWRLNEVICAQTISGERFPLVIFDNKTGRKMSLRLRKGAEKKDLQKQIVKRVMKEVEKNDVYVIYCPSSGIDNQVVPRDTCFEKLVVEFDLEAGLRETRNGSSH